MLLEDLLFVVLLIVLGSLGITALWCFGGLLFIRLGFAFDLVGRCP